MKSSAVPIIILVCLAHSFVVSTNPDANSTSQSNSTGGGYLVGKGHVDAVAKAHDWLSSEKGRDIAYGLFKQIVTRNSGDATNTTEIVVDTELKCLHIQPWCMMASFTQVPIFKSSSSRSIDIGSTTYTCTNELSARINETYEFDTLDSHAVEMTIYHSCSQSGKILKFGTQLPTDESQTNIFNGIDLTNLGRGLLTHKLHEAK